LIAPEIALLIFAGDFAPGEDTAAADLFAALPHACHIGTGMDAAGAETPPAVGTFP
jgi:hypothetical protein